ncbi:MAG: hypothetical protein PWP31_806 [Clostridia bacterium]|nr:hypothetical protein [Clostridia bacterium]
MDKYVSGQSKIGRITEDNREVRLDLQLENNIYSDNVLIYGYITDSYEKPIQNASVSFFNQNNKEIGSIYSSEEGFYSYGGIKLNSKITDKIFDIDIKLSKRDTETKITGQIQDNTGKLISNAIVLLYRVEENGKIIPVKHTISDKEGRYIFTNIPYNKYIVKAKL